MVVEVQQVEGHTLRILRRLLHRGLVVITQLY